MSDVRARRVGVIMGGSSGERDVSLRSGEAVAKALESRGHQVVRVELPLRAEDASAAISNARIDVAFLALHGRHGEDGCIQGLLELAGIPYTGSGVLTSALAMDKQKAKELFRLHNVPTPPYYTVTANEDLDGLAQKHGSFGFPVVVKPRGEGSSLGVRRASDLGELAECIEAAFELDDCVIVERFVAGMEVNVGILDGKVLGAIEIAPKSASGMYDYEAKYTPGMTSYFMPARLPAARLVGVSNLAERAAAALGCTGAVRVDLLVTSGENEYVLEVNTLPGMTETSLLPKIAAASGIDFGNLCEKILDGARLHSGSGGRGQRKSRVRSGEFAAPAGRAAAIVAPLRVAKSA